MSIATKQKNAIEINHVGPIERLTIPVPAGGGVVILHGASGVGKSHAIRSVAALTSPDAAKSLRVSDGSQSGTIDGLGVTVRLGRTNRRLGELECLSLEGGIDPSQLVEPGIKDPVAADSKRLSTLIRLAGVKIDPAKWGTAVGRFADEIALPDLVSDDPIATADKIRRRLHDVALKNERIAQSKGAEGVALKKSIADVDTSVQVDATVQLDAATRRLNDLYGKRNLWFHANTKVAEAKKRLEESSSTAVVIDKLQLERADYERDLIDCTADRDDVLRQIAKAEKLISSLQTEAAELRFQQEISGSQIIERDKQIRLCQDQAAEIASLRLIVESSLPESVSEEAIQQAVVERQAAIDLVAQSEVIARARKTESVASVLIEESRWLSDVAEAQREIARSTDTVLEQSLIDAGYDRVKVSEGRLCVETDRGLEPVSDLSTGERWKLALDLAAQGLQPDAILTVQQEGWQSLDEGLRADVAGMCRERGLLIVTAQVDAGELRVEVLE